MKKKDEKEVLEDVKPKEVSKQSEDYKDMYVRVVADFQNFKKRTEQEKVEWIRAGQRDAITPLLAVLDDLDRAAESFKDNREVLVGLQLTQKNSTKVFQDLGVTPIDCSGEFNPEIHEAMVQVESADHEAGQIVDVMSNGYMLNSYVLRHAKVSVAK